MKQSFLLLGTGAFLACAGLLFAITGEGFPGLCFLAGGGFVTFVGHGMKEDGL